MAGKSSARKSGTGSAVSPDSSEVICHLRYLAKRYPRLAKMKKCGSSAAGRPIHTLTLTDPSFPAKDKQHALIVGGRHGNEESGRMIALALADWLLTREGRPILRKQKVVILPNANPDACELDIYAPPSGIHICHDLDAKKPIPETSALDSVAQALMPDMLVDMHSRGHAGCSSDMVLYSIPRRYTEDDNLFHEVARKMCVAGEKEGLPHFTHPLSWWSDEDNGICANYYQQFKTLAMLTETSESNTHCHSGKLRTACGIARLKAILLLGNQRHPKLFFPGYPNALAIGSYHLGIVALGKTAAARRKSRVAIWRNVADFHRLSGINPEKDREKSFRLVYKGKTIKEGVGIQIQARHKSPPKAVYLAGKKLRKSGTVGYTTWRSGGSTFVMAAIAELRRRTYELKIDF